jgi:hypothetical protein
MGFLVLLCGITSCEVSPDDQRKTDSLTAIQLTEDLLDLTKRMDSAIASKVIDSMFYSADTMKIHDFQFDQYAPAEGTKKIELKGDTFQSYSKHK